MASEVDLTTAAAASSRPGLSGIAELASLVTAASEALRDWLGYPLHQRVAQVETCRGGGQRLFLQAGAVQSISSITCYGSTREAGTYKLEDDVKSVILSLDGAWPFTGHRGCGVSEAQLFREDTGDIQVTFTAGWVTPGQVALDGSKTRTLPSLFEEACILTLQAWPRAGNPNVRSRSTGNASVSYGPGADNLVPPQARALVKRYRKHGR